MTDQNGWEPWDDEFEPAIFWERLLESGPEPEAPTKNLQCKCQWLRNR